MRLEAAALQADDPNRLREDAIWIQVAREGTFRGHSTGEFTFDRASFEQMVANFRAHPSYEVGPDGWGIADVIPFDFHHESERSGGDVGIIGAPAQAWALDLEIREGENGVELWALTRYLEPARSYVSQGKYKWTSIAVWPDACHPVTGETIGWYISSIAFTNDPFIQGMAPIAAQRPRVGKLLSATVVGDAAVDVDELMYELRWLFDLAQTDGVAEVMAKIAWLEATATSDNPPPAGVDVLGLVARIRDLLRLPLLTPIAAVFSTVRDLLGKLNDATPSQPELVITQPPMAADRGNEMSKLIALAKRAKLAATITNEDEAAEALSAALDESVRHRDVIRSLVSASRLGPSATAVELERTLLEGNSAREKLAAIGKMFGVENPDDVLDAVAKQTADLAALKDAIPELEEMLQNQATEEETLAEDDVEETMQAHRMPRTAKVAMLALRTGGIDLRGPHKLSRDELARRLEQRRKQREKFLQAYPVPNRQHARLTRPLVTPGPSAGAASLLSWSGPAMVPDAPLGASSQGNAPVLGGAIDLDAYPGRNHVEKAMSFVRSQPGGDELSHDAAWKRALAVLRQ